MQDNICQLRLDFDTFNIAQPNSDTAPDNFPSVRTQCLEAQFVATSNDRSVPTICGYNNGQHIYLEAEDSCNDVTFAWQNAKAVREWRIRVSQILCGDPNKRKCSSYEDGT